MSASPLRILFAGTPGFAASHLGRLIASKHHILAVYTQPDRPAGRGRKLHASPVKQMAELAGLTVCQPASLKNEEAQRQLAAFNADVIGGGADTLGILMTGSGIGALAGSLVLAKLGDIGQKGRVMFYAGYLWAIFIAGFALSETLVAAFAFGLATGLFGALMGSLNMSVVQIALPDHIRGRVMAIMMMAHGFMPIGIIPISVVAENVGIDIALLLAAFLLAASLFLLRVWIPELATIDRGHDEDEDDDLLAPQTAKQSEAI